MGAAEWPVNGPENRGLPDDPAVKFDSSTHRRLSGPTPSREGLPCARVLLGEQLDSKPNVRRSNRRPSANFLRREAYMESER